MKRMQVTCSKCGGTGYFHAWKEVATDGITTTMEREEFLCQSCNGSGYTEYAVFSVEEAETILKHCGLTSES